MLITTILSVRNDSSSGGSNGKKDMMQDWEEVGADMIQMKKLKKKSKKPMKIKQFNRHHQCGRLLQTTLKMTDTKIR